ncbi:MAG: dienelactone hydrolase family protein [Alphaproteobacteria bacterium]|nr:dienelactone hydrolase family protein [Alphaproteobacteria bacterium]
MNIELTAADGHKLAAWRADPPKGAKPRGAIVVIQEIFGANSHMRRVTDGFAADGYVAICPALFDRVKRGVDLGYGPDDIAQGRDLRGKIAWPQVLADTAAAIAEARKSGKVGVVGYCWGGSVAWRAATQLDCDAAVGYYGGMVAEFAGEQPKCPVMLHFGELDASIPLADVDKIKKAHPGLPVHVYPADHGFNCDDRRQYDATAARLARERTLAFFRQHVG